MGIRVLKFRQLGLILSFFTLVSTGNPTEYMSAAHAQSGQDAQSLFETARRNNNVSDMIRAAQLQEHLESDGSAAQADVSSAEMVSIALSLAADDFAFGELMQMFDNYTWELMPGSNLIRRRPMPVNQQTSFEFKIMTSSSFALRVVSRKQRARYMVNVHSANGQLLCGSASASFDFSCRFDAAMRDTIRVSIESVGPFDSHLEVAIN